MTIEKLSKMIEVSSGKNLADLVIRNCKVVDPISATITDADILRMQILPLLMIIL